MSQSAAHAIALALFNLLAAVLGHQTKHCKHGSRSVNHQHTRGGDGGAYDGGASFPHQSHFPASYSN